MVALIMLAPSLFSNHVLTRMSIRLLNMCMTPMMNRTNTAMTVSATSVSTRPVAITRSKIWNR